MNMPKLEGSEKQIRWAEDIRNCSIESYQKYNLDSEKYSTIAVEFLMRDLIKRGYKFEPTQETKILEKSTQLKMLSRIEYSEIMERISTVKDASVFINHRPTLDVLQLFPDLTDLHYYTEGLIPMIIPEKYYKEGKIWHI